MLATTVTSKWKSILIQEFDRRTKEGSNDADNENNKEDVEQEEEEKSTEHDATEENCNKSIFITPSPKYRETGKETVPLHRV